ncbi:MAG: hypothetical protein VX248_17225 [Pseudomonadota bacterium]|nr:hypothetical protein [Pseudomonadota bacterium]
MFRDFAFVTLSALTLSACMGPNLTYGPEATTTNYTDPHASGLSAVRPFPTPADVCQVVREHEAIREPATDGSFLVACPKHERGALENRVAEGGTIIGHAKHWTILAYPQHQ